MDIKQRIRNKEIKGSPVHYQHFLCLFLFSCRVFIDVVLLFYNWPDPSPEHIHVHVYNFSVLIYQWLYCDI